MDKNYTLGKKIKLAEAAVIGGLAFFLLVNVLMHNAALNEFDHILDLNTRCYDLQQALTGEKRAFLAYMMEPSEETEDASRISYIKSKRCIDSILHEAREIDREIYMHIWTIWNVYDYYSGMRDSFLEMDKTNPVYLERLYELYEIQDYMEVYSVRLVGAVLDWGNGRYLDKIDTIRMQQWVQILVCVAAIAVIIWAGSYINRMYVRPMVLLSEDAKRIAGNDFSGEAIVSGSHDEMSVLVKEFQRMKAMTKGFMDALKREKEMELLLHQKELRQMELEKETERVRLQALKNQINPHFLFNTLNVIACNARVEHDAVTGKMIRSLSSLLRYNLRTTSALVTLEQELTILNHYIYIQKMRFGDRLQVAVACPEKLMGIMIPPFTLQPLVENSVIHGLSKKPGIGSIQIRVAETDGRIFIVVADNGAGIETKKLRKLRFQMSLRGGTTANAGIGLGNITKRLRILCEGGVCRIFSKPGIGTGIVLILRESGDMRDETFTDSAG